MWRYFVSLFSKMGDKGGERGQKSQKMGDVIYGRPFPTIHTYSNIISFNKDSLPLPTRE